MSVTMKDPSLRGFKPYAKYKDPGVRWLGEIPAHWDARRLKFVSVVIMGQSPPSEQYNMLGDGLPFLQGNADFGAEHPAPRVFCPTPSKTVQPGDHLVSVRAPVGALNTADQHYGIGRGLCAVRVRPPLMDNRFAQWALAVARVGLNSIAVGSTYEAVSVDDVAGLVIPLPKDTEQGAIARFLDRETARIDGLVAKEERLIELLQEKRVALITRAVTKGLDTSVPMKDSGVEWLGQIPAHWDTWRLKHVSGGLTVGVVVNPSHYVSPSGVPFLRGADVSEGRIVLKNVQYMSEGSNREHYKSTLRQGDLVSIRVGYPGVTAVVPAELEGSNCASLLISRRSKRVNSDLLCYLMNSAVGKAQFKMLQDGAAQEQINVSDAVDFVVPLPPPREQATIVAYLDVLTSSIDTLLVKVREAIERLKELRTALISAAVTGKIDVRAT